MAFVKHVWPDFIEGKHHKQVAQKFNDIANEMSSASSELGGAIAAVKSISKNGMMLSAMGSLASGIASKCGLPAPPSMEDAFATIADGTCGQALNVLNSGMSAVNSIAQLPPYSGHLDDMNEVVWQGLNFGTTGINLPFLGGGTLEGGSVTTIPAPAWVNPNPHLGSTTGSFPAGKSIGEAFTQAKADILKNVETCQKQIEAALSPIMDLGNAACGAAGAFDLSATVLPNINPGLEALYQKANESYQQMSPAEKAAAQEAAFQRRAEAEANRS